MFLMNDSSERVQTLSPKKRALLELRLKKSASAFPLSFAQQRLWFLDQIETGHSFYNVPIALRLTGILDNTALEAALVEIVRRHEALRTCFPVINGEPRQQILTTQPLEFPLDDLSSLPASQREVAMQELIRDEASAPFTLESGPLFRARLLRLAAEEHVLSLNTHHIVSDGWSIGVLINELTILYTAYVQEQPSPLAELPIQYADYAIWQRQRLQGEVLQEQLQYWREQLQEAPALELPTDHPRPAVQSFRGRRHSVVLDHGVSEQLKELSRREGVTLFMTLLAAWQVLLSRYSGQEEIVVGSPIAGRTRGETEGLIGFFVNTLVLRGDLSGDPSFVELLQRVKEVCLGAYEHQELPFEKLVEELQPERSLSHNPLFQVMFVLQNTPREDFRLPGLEMSSMRADNETVRFDLTLIITDQKPQLALILEYSSDLYAEATAKRMLGHFEKLLAGIVAAPSQCLSQLPLLTAAEQAQLAAWNDTARPLPENACIHQLFEEQVRLTPDAMAVSDEKEQLSYAELNARSNRLAHYLREQGVGAEVLVGICMERSVEMVVSLLAILKAGGAYVPLDPTYPEQRLNYMLQDAGVRLLLSERKLWARMTVTEAVRVLCREDWSAALAQYSTLNPAVEMSATNLAYVSYTSGSTGVPKGVGVTHRNVARLVKETNYVEIRREDVFLQFAPVSFDASTFELWGCLTNGARLAVYGPELPSLEELGRYIKSQRVSVLWLTAGLFHQMVDEELENLLGVRQLLAGGDVLSAGHVRKYLSGGGQELINGYGPTESTTFTCCESVRAAEEVGETVSIGEPIENTTVYVLDEAMQLVPVGVRGELYIGGEGLARGYLQRPELTAERFVPHPYSLVGGERLYRTGDEVRWSTSGRLEFIGRLDQQVKLRGYRIELGEIEAVLNSHPGVSESVVITREDEPGEKNLVAYLIPDLHVQGTNDQITEVQSEHVAQWQVLYEDTYSLSAPEEDSTFNTIGWNSSYTGEPIPAIEMREWLTHTVTRIRSLRPSRVLEIGCGTGLLLFQIAPHCESYVGTDFSRVALQNLQQELDVRGLSNVMLHESLADDFSRLESQTFDTIVVNSVVQYFPSIDYLVKVLEGAVRLLAPGGKIFIGDVRSLPLLEAFHTAVQLHQAPASLSTRKLQQRIQKEMLEEEELVIDPAFFFALKQHLPGINHIQVQHKRGNHHNELTQFRYDVTIHVNADDLTNAEEQPELDWELDGLDVPALRQLLIDRKPGVLRLTRVPNARLAATAKALTILASQEQPGTAGELKDSVRAACANSHAIEPEALWGLSDELPYHVNIVWAGKGEEEYCDVILTRQEKANDDVEESSSFTTRQWKTTSRAWTSYANAPLRAKLTRNLVPQVRSYAKERLPEYMIPSAILVLEQLPLTANGKVNRRELPAPDGSRPELAAAYVGPRTVVEEALVGIWSEVLRVEQVGIHDNFFELGGHSLLATQVVSRVRQVLQCEVPLRSLFERPTVAGLAEQLEGKSESSSVLPAVVAVSREQALPLSFAQQRLWLIDQLESNPAAYNIYAALKLRGELQLKALEMGLAEIVRRHEALRTCFPVLDGEPVQLIRPAGSLPLPLTDLSDRADAASLVAGIAQEEAQQRFDLAAGPLFRARLLRLGAEEHVLLLNMHHIVSDGWSIGVLVKELSALYTVYAQGQPSPLMELAIQYADYAVWQRQWLQGEVLQEQLQYWREQLQGAPAVLELPTDHPRPAVQSFRGGRQSLLLDHGVSERLKELSRREGVTLFMTLLAAWQVLLSRYSGQEEIVVGSPIAGRTRSETEGLIGFFVNTLVLRGDLSGDPSFVELLQRVKEVCLGAYGHQEVPFEKLVEELQPERSLSHNPLFQVMFVLQNTPREDFRLPGLELTPIKVDNESTKFDLTLLGSQRSGDLHLELEYNADLFDVGTVQRMLGHLECCWQESWPRRANACHSCRC